jgi:hypothetical protein
MDWITIVISKKLETATAHQGLEFTIPATPALCQTAPFLNKNVIVQPTMLMHSILLAIPSFQG